MIGRPLGKLLARVPPAAGRHRTAIALSLLLVALVAVGLWLLPMAARRLATARIEDMTGLPASIADVDLNLFTRRIAVKRFVLGGAAPGEPPLATASRLDARFDLSALVTGRVHLRSVRLEDPLVRIVRFSRSDTNVAPVLERIASRRGGSPVAYELDHLVVESGRVAFEDRAAPEPVVWEATALRAELTDIATAGDADRGTAEARFTLAGAPVTITAAGIRMRPLHARVTVDARALDLRQLWAYVPADAAVAAESGSLTAHVQAEYDASDGAARASGQATVSGLVLRWPGWPGRRLEVPALLMISRDVVYQDGVLSAGHLETRAEPVLVDARAAPVRRDAITARVTVDGAHYPRGEPAHVRFTAGLPGGARLEAAGTAVFVPLAIALEATVRDLDVARARPYLPADLVVAPSAGMADATVRLELGEGLRAGGDAVVRGLVLERNGRTLAQVPELHAGATGVAWDAARVRVGRLAIRGSPTIADPGGQPARAVRLDPVELVLEDAALPAAAPARAELRATLGTGGTVVASGTIRLAPLAAHLRVLASDVDVAAATPYVPADAPIAPGRGTLFASLDVEYGPGRSVRVDGDFGTTRLTLRRSGQAAPFVVHPRLRGEVTGATWRDGALAIERLVLAGRPTVIDTTARPAQRYAFASVGVTADGLTWPSRGPARLRLAAMLRDGGAAAAEGTFDPGTRRTEARVEAAGVDLSRLDAYLPPGAAMRVQRGLAGLAATLTQDPSAGLRASGTATLRDLALRRPGDRIPIARAPKLVVSIDGLVVDDGAASAETLSVAGAPTVAAPGTGAVALRRLRVEATGVAWPARQPVPVRVAAELAPEGRVSGNGTVRADARSLDLALDLEGVALAAIRPLLPLGAELHGRVNGQLEVGAALGGAPRVTARGSLTADAVALGPRRAAPLSVARVEVHGLALDWPSALSVGRIALIRPSAFVERTADGDLPLRDMLRSPLPDRRPGTPRTAASAAGSSASRMTVTVGEISVEQGDVRFVDRATTPDYSEEITELSVSVDGLTTGPDRRAQVAVHGVVGVDGALELRGELAPFARPFFLELRGELTDFSVPRTNPYMLKFLDWYARRGALTTKLRYRVVGDRIDGINELVVQRLDVRRERAARGPGGDRIGIPLGLAVAVLKRPGGDIRLTVPVGGRLGAPDWSFGDAFARALKNVLVKALTAPFRAIGRIVRGPRGEGVEEIAIEPVVFPPGRAEVTPEARKHLQRVGDFLRASPYVGLVLEPVVTDADLAALRSQAAAARVQQAQRTADVDFAGAARALYQERFADRPVPDDVSRIMAELSAAEPLPAGPAQALASRRLGSARRLLADSAGIEPERLSPGSALLRGRGQGRVEFEMRAE